MQAGMSYLCKHGGTQQLQISLFSRTSITPHHAPVRLLSIRRPERHQFFPANENSNRETINLGMHSNPILDPRIATLGWPGILVYRLSCCKKALRGCVVQCPVASATVAVI